MKAVVDQDTRRVVTNRGGLADAPGFYDGFDRRAGGVVKAVLRPG